MTNGINPVALGKAVEVFKNIAVDNIIEIMPHNDPVRRKHPKSNFSVGLDVPVRMVAINEYQVNGAMIRRKIKSF